MPPLFPFFDRHPISAGWLGTAAIFSADALASMQEADAVLKVCIRAVGLIVGICSLYLTALRIREKHREAAEKRARAENAEHERSI